MSTGDKDTAATATTTPAPIPPSTRRVIEEATGLAGLIHMRAQQIIAAHGCRLSPQPWLRDLLVGELQSLYEARARASASMPSALLRQLNKFISVFNAISAPPDVEDHHPPELTNSADPGMALCKAFSAVEASARSLLGTERPVNQDDAEEGMNIKAGDGGTYGPGGDVNIKAGDGHTDDGDPVLETKDPTLLLELEKKHPAEAAPRLFISYTHDSDVHKKRVLELAQLLRDDGLDCMIDQFIKGTPAEGWPLWMERQIEKAAFVLVVCTATYLRRYEAKETPGKGLGGTWEAVLTRQDLYEAQAKNEKFVPVLFEGASPEDVPKPLRPFTYHRLPAGYDDLYRYLTDQPKVAPKKVGTQKEMPPDPASEPVENINGQTSTDSEQSKTLLQNKLHWISNHKKLNIIVFCGIILITIGTASGAIDKIMTLFVKLYDSVVEDRPLSVFGWVETINGRRLVRANIRINNVADDLTSDNGEFSIPCPSNLVPGDPIYLYVKDWILIEPTGGETFIPNDMALRVVVAHKGEHGILSSQKLISSIVWGESTRIRSTTFQSVSTDAYINQQAERFGVSSGDLRSAIADWLDNVRGPYQRGLVALREHRYIEASKNIAESISGSEKDVVDRYIALASAEYELANYRDAEAALKRARAISPKNARVLNDLGLVLIAVAEFMESKKVLSEALILSENALGPDHSNIATTLNNLALVYHKQGKYSVAEQLLLRVLSIHKKAFCHNEPIMALSLNNLALVYLRQDRYQEAAPILLMAQEILEENHRSRDKDLAVTLTNRASLLRATGKYEESERMLLRAINIFKSARAKPNLARSLDGLALVYFTRGWYQKAEPLFREALQIRKDVFGDEHPEVAAALNSLGVFLSDQNRMDEAQLLQENALEMAEKIFRPDHPSLAVFLGNLAACYRDKGMHDRALPLFERALAIAEKAFGMEHLHVAPILRNLAILYRKQKRYSEAESLQKRALTIRLRHLGPNHTEVAGCYNSLGILYMDQGLYEKAEQSLERSLEIVERALGNDHLDVAKAKATLAKCYIKQNEYNSVEELIKQSLPVYEKVLGEESLEVINSLMDLAMVYCIQQRFKNYENVKNRIFGVLDKAPSLEREVVASELSNIAKCCLDKRKYDSVEALLKRSLKIVEKVKGPQHTSVATILNNLAFFYHHARGRYKKAETLYNRVLKIRKSRLPHNHPEIIAVLKNLASLYRAQGRTEEADKLLRREKATTKKKTDHR